MLHQKNIAVSIKIITGWNFFPLSTSPKSLKLKKVSVNNVEKEYHLSKRPVQRQNSRSLLGKDQSLLFPRYRRHLQVSSFLRTSRCALFKKICICALNISPHPVLNYSLKSFNSPACICRFCVLSLTLKEHLVAETGTGSRSFTVKP